jgi:Effector Associated Constant Component 1
MPTAPTGPQLWPLAEVKWPPGLRILTILVAGGEMAADAIQVKLVLDAQDGDEERTEEDLRYLLDELVQTDAVSIGREPSGQAPPGAKGPSADVAGTLLIALGGSGATLPVLVGLVRDWLNRRGSGTVRLKIGSDEVELTRASSAMQQQVLDEFLGRHQE